MADTSTVTKEELIEGSMADTAIVTKEIFLKGCKFFYKTTPGSFYSIPTTDKKDIEPVHLNNSNNNHFANVSKVDKSGFNFYTEILGKTFSGRVLFENLILLHRKEVSNG
jgi:hypothetical protein